MHKLTPAHTPLTHGLRAPERRTMKPMQRSGVDHHLPPAVSLGLRSLVLVLVCMTCKSPYTRTHTHTRTHPSKPGGKGGSTPRPKRVSGSNPDFPSPPVLEALFEQDTLNPTTSPHERRRVRCVLARARVVVSHMHVPLPWKQTLFSQNPDSPRACPRWEAGRNANRP